MKTPKKPDAKIAVAADVRAALASLRRRVTELESAQRMRRIELALIPVRPVAAGSNLAVPRDAAGRFSGTPTVSPDAMRRAYGTTGGGLLSPKAKLLRALLRDFKPTQQ